MARDPAEPDEIDAAIERLAAAYRGHVRTLEPGRGRGTIQAGDRTLSFDFGNLRLSGALKRPDDLRPGMAVTFDVSVLPGGPRIVRIWAG